MAGKNDAPAIVGKGRPTPTRKEREALRKRPLVLDKKADSARRRAENRARIDRENKAMATGDDRNMPAKYQGSPRRFARDFVDSRTTVGEFLLPAAFIALIIMLFFPTKVALVGSSSIVLFLMLISWLVESVWLLRRMKRQAIEKFGEDRLPPRFTRDAFTRMAQMRRLRLPKPQVRRGEFPI
jgi:Flp pilus assembly protein TadB